MFFINTYFIQIYTHILYLKCFPFYLISVFIIDFALKKNDFFNRF